MSAPVLSPHQQAARLFLDTLTHEMDRLGPQLGCALDLEAHAHGIHTAERVGLPVFINLLCSFFGRYCLSDRARWGLRPYSVKLDQVFVLGGRGLDDDPAVVVVPSFDELVHAIHRLDDNSFMRFSVPHRDALDPRNGPMRAIHHMVGPTSIPRDGGYRAVGNWNPERRYTKWQHRFIDGELGIKGTPYQIDSDAAVFEHDVDARIRFAGHNCADGRRVVWSLVSPRDADTAADAEGEPTSKSAVWSLELEVPGQPMAFYRVIFSQEYVEARARAEQVVRAQMPHVPFSREPWWRGRVVASV